LEYVCVLEQQQAAEREQRRELARQKQAEFEQQHAAEREQRRAQQRAQIQQQLTYGLPTDEQAAAQYALFNGMNYSAWPPEALVLAISVETG
jgi:regulator of protease activity HflC (stomatin/prohibitin superfamily)